jgi:hypothetical protein
MSKWDPTAPTSLKAKQEWFGSIIGTPINLESCLIPSQKTGQAGDYISPSQTLTPFDRMEIYSQQYWWRLLRALQENFPLLTRLFGTADFNETIGKPALKCYPPTHWSLSQLGREIVNWINHHYQGEDRSLVSDAARIDWFTTKALTAPQHPPLSLQELTPELTKRPLRLQPHLHLLTLKADLFKFREKLLEKEPDGWLNEPFPALDKTSGAFAIYRDHKQAVTYCSLHPKEIDLLIALQKGDCLEKASAQLTQQEAPQLLEWCQKWALRKWISLPS